MGGSGTVLGAARAIAELKPNVEVHFIVASCENMVSANAYRPGDIITASNGKTIEVGNTDAGTLVGDVLCKGVLRQSVGDSIPECCKRLLVSAREFGVVVIGALRACPGPLHQLAYLTQCFAAPLHQLAYLTQCFAAWFSTVVPGLWLVFLFV